MTLTVNISIEQGTDYYKVIPLLDDAGNPQDFSGCSGILELATEYGAPTVITLSTGDETLILREGEGVLDIPNAQTSALLQGTLVGDLLIKNANGHVRKVRTIVAAVNPTVSQFPPSPPPSPPAAANGIESEDGSTNLSAEDGSTNLTQES